MRRGQAGVALAIVVWFIAGMSLLVAGIVAEARMDTRMAQLHYFRAQAAAAGDGAINLVLAEQIGARQLGEAGLARATRTRIGPHPVEVRVLPAVLLVNLNTATQAEFVQLFTRTLESPRVPPRQLATRVIRYRDGGGGDRPHKFMSMEDLLRVTGVDRAVYDAVRDYVVVDALSGGQPPVRGRGNFFRGRLNQLAAANNGAGGALDGTVPTWVNTLRLDALVTIGDQQWLRRRWVRIGSDPNSNLPWQVLRSDATRPLPRRNAS